MLRESVSSGSIHPQHGGHGMLDRSHNPVADLHSQPLLWMPQPPGAGRDIPLSVARVVVDQDVPQATVGIKDSENRPVLVAHEIT